MALLALMDDFWWDLEGGDALVLLNLSVVGTAQYP